MIVSKCGRREVPGGPDRCPNWRRDREWREVAAAQSVGEAQNARSRRRFTNRRHYNLTFSPPHHSNRITTTAPRNGLHLGLQAKEGNIRHYRRCMQVNSRETDAGSQTHRRSVPQMRLGGPGFIVLACP